MKKTRVLVVEDEKDVQELMLLHLNREGHEVSSVENGDEAIKLLEQTKYDLVVLDWMLPGASGIQVCKNIAGRIPVLMVTARADSADIIKGLDAGADDYITKPFEIPVFIARVRALLRRSVKLTEESVSTTPSNVLKAGDLVVDLERHEIQCGPDNIHLTPSEFKLLKALLENQGRVLSRERLIDLVQGEGVAVVDRAIDTHVFGLRKKLGACQDVIETIRGIGYRIKSDTK